ncbi:MAG: response regulator [Candidatus Obscuribacterales bacterium]|nr:response regulator [Candidatus Obscuribacterales bacterium]
MSKRVLVVDDDLAGRKVTSRQLELLGIPHHAVTCGTEAVEHGSLCCCHLILMNVEMPDMNGLEATKSIREQELVICGHRHTIIALTGTDDRKACLDAGMDDYLQKPILLKQLRSAMDKWLL